MSPTFAGTVGPYAFEAEDYMTPMGGNSWVMEDTSALSGRVAVAQRVFSLSGLPLPRTDRPVTVWLRARPGVEQVEYRLIVPDATSRSRSLGSVTSGGAVGQWEWVRFAPLSSADVGSESFGIELHQPAGRHGRHAMDRVVITTEELTEAALGAAPPLLAHRPLVMAARCEAPPTIDGSADDPCWDATLACTDFMVVGSASGAEAATTARLCYDDEHLYALFVCEEPILEVAGQRLHEFKANVRQRDGGVHADDCVILLLDSTHTGGQAFEISVNALGIVEDARCTGVDLWESRDTSWQADIRAAGRIEDGHWIVEMAIPLAALSDAAPDDRSVWRIALGRVARARNEASSWSPSNRGIHDPLPWGALTFGRSPVGAALRTPASLQLGANALEARLTLVDSNDAAKKAAASEGVYLAAYMATAPVTRNWGVETNVARSYRFAEAAKEAITVTHAFEVKQEEPLEVAYGILDAASLRPLYLTPAMTKGVRSSTANVLISCAGPFELYLNGELLKRGEAAQALELRAALQKGPNLFAVKAEQGTAAVRIIPAGSESPVLGNWKMAPLPGAGAEADGGAMTSPSLDDRGWVVAPRIGDDPQVGPIHGESGVPVVLRQTLLWEKTRVWPTPEPAYYLARGITQHLNVLVEGLQGRPLDGWTTYLATPAEFEIVGASGFYATTTPDQPDFQFTDLGTQRVAGREMAVVKITADKPVRAGRHHIMSMFNAFVRYRDSAGEPSEPSAVFHYWSEANDGTVVEPPRTFHVRVLPAVNGRQPKKLLWQLYGGWIGQMDDPAMRTQVLDAARLAGFNDLVAGASSADRRWLSNHAPDYGIRFTQAFNFKELYWGGLDEYLKEHPDQQLVAPNGKPDAQFLCTSLMLGESWAAVEQTLAVYIEKRRPHALDYDYEYGPLKVHEPHTCYCPRCLSAFRQYAKLASDIPLDGSAIRRQYAAQWVDFNAYRVAEVCAKLKQTIHRLAPGTKFSLYSGYQTPEQPEQYGLDWRYVGDMQACDFAVCGYGRPVQATRDTIAALKGIPLSGGTILRPYRTGETWPLVPVAKAEILRTLLDCRGGVMLYDRSPMDGRTWHAFGEISRLAAEYEELFIHGELKDWPGHDPRQVQAISAGTTPAVTLLCVMNSGSTATEHTIKIPAAIRAGHEFFSGKRVTADRTVRGTLEPGDAAVWVLRE